MMTYSMPSEHSKISFKVARRQMLSEEIVNRTRKHTKTHSIRLINLIQWQIQRLWLAECYTQSCKHLSFQPQKIVKALFSSSK